MTNPPLYADLAGLYDLIYHDKDYAAEAARLHDLLAGEGVGDGATLLEAACGTGNYLEQLQAWYAVSGFDRSEAMLDRARTRLPRVPLSREDLIQFSVATPVDVVVCLFSSIGYLTTAADLARAARRFADALVPGGTLVIEPWITPDDYKGGRPALQTYLSDDLKLSRACVARRDGDLALIDFHWLIARAGQGVEHVVDPHVLWMCTRERMTGVLQGAGLEVRFEERGLTPDHRGLYICRKPVARA